MPFMYVLFVKNTLLFGGNKEKKNETPEIPNSRCVFSIL